VKTNKSKTYKVLNALLGPAVRPVAGVTIQRLMGFHLLWHMLGGEKALRDLGWDYVTVWRAKKDFQRIFGATVEDGFPELADFARSIGVGREAN
jgi:hypothetical protein